jgi:hypothetical protein
MAYAYLGQSTLARLQRDHPTAVARAEDALAMFRALGEPLGQARALEALAAAIRPGDRAQADAYTDDAVALYRRMGHRRVPDAESVETTDDTAPRRSDDHATRPM